MYGDEGRGSNCGSIGVYGNHAMILHKPAFAKGWIGNRKAHAVGLCGLESRWALEYQKVSPVMKTAYI